MGKRTTHLHGVSALSPHFYTYNGEIWHAEMDQGFTTHTKFCKNCSKDLPFMDKFIPKIPNFHDFGGRKPIFLYR